MRRALSVLALTVVAGLAAPVAPALAHDGTHGKSEAHRAAQPHVPHVDPPPPGVDVRRRVPTAELVAGTGVLRRPGVRRTRTVMGKQSVPRMAAEADATVVSSLYVPPGESSVGGLAGHFSPSCSGTGTDGKRVQVLYAYEAGTTNRFAEVKDALLSRVADVDDTFAMSSVDHNRRVRWVFDPLTCVPDLRAVQVPAGSLVNGPGYGRQAIVDAAEAAGIQVTDRRVLTFADVARICGIGERWNHDVAGQENYNNDSRTLVGRVDNGCWNYPAGTSSPAAHELMHTLGGVQGTAPHATTLGHCTDELDAMCYVDGGLPTTMSSVCTTAGYDALFDCNNDDYYHSGTPAAGTYLATHWNTANSGYLDVVNASGMPVPVTPTGSVQGPASLRPGLAATLTASSDVPATVAWTANQPVCLPGAKTSPTVVVQCPTTASGSLTVTATFTGTTGLTSTTVKTISLNPATAAPLSIALTAPTTVYVGSPARLSAAVRSGTTGVRSDVSLQYRPSGSTTWTTLSSARTNLAGAMTWNLTRSGVATGTYRVLVAQAATARWTMPTPVLRTVRVVRRPTSTVIGLRTGRPNVLSALVRTNTGAAVAGRTVRLQAKLPGSTVWRTVATRTTTSTGRASASVQPRRKTYYRWVFGTTTALSASTSLTKTVLY